MDNHEKLLAILFCLSISFLFHYQVFFIYLNFDCVECLAFCVSVCIVNIILYFGMIVMKFEREKQNLPCDEERHNKIKIVKKNRRNITKIWRKYFFFTIFYRTNIMRMKNSVSGSFNMLHVWKSRLGLSAPPIIWGVILMQKTLHKHFTKRCWLGLWILF
jgi:hypothetical protein